MEIPKIKWMITEVAPLGKLHGYVHAQPGPPFSSAPQDHLRQQSAAEEIAANSRNLETIWDSYWWKKKINAGNFREWSNPSLIVSSSQQPPATHPATLRKTPQ